MPEKFVDELQEAYKTVTERFDAPATRRSVNQMVVSLPGIVNRMSDGGLRSGHRLCRSTRVRVLRQ